MAEEPLIEMAIRIGFVSSEQVEEAKRLQQVLAGNGFSLSLPEIFLKKEWLSREKWRALNIIARYEDLRADDERFGSFIVRNGFLPEEKVRESLEIQRGLYEEGRNFARLQELLLQKGHLNPQQVQVINRARVQIEAQKMAQKSGTATIPSVKLPIGGEPAVPRPAATATPRPMPAPAGARKAGIDQGFAVDGCKITVRRSKVKDAQGRDNELLVLDMDGVLDGHTFKPFDEFVSAVVDQGCRNVIINFEKVDYVSSAGIGVLAGSVKRCRDAKGDLRLCNVQDKVKKIINLVGLQTLLRMYDQERGAVLSFKYI